MKKIKGKLLKDYKSLDIFIKAGTEVNVLQTNVMLDEKECTIFKYGDAICIDRVENIEVEDTKENIAIEKMMQRLDKKIDEEIAKGIYNDISVEIKTAAAKEWFI